MLSDPELRRLHRRNAGTCADALGLDARDKALLKELSNIELENQAQALLDKRYSAVRHLIPHTIARLGAKANDTFMRFAVGYWPVGHLRHKQDAIAFCKRLVEDGSRAVCWSELNGLSFQTGNERLRVHFVRDLPVQRRSVHAMQILFRVRGRVRGLALNFGI